MVRLELVGQRFGRLKVLSFSKMDNGSIWNCLCDCGKHITIKGCYLTSGNTRSCGCLIKDFPNYKTHGMTLSREYQSWGHMLQRCCNPNHKYYFNYGGRGVKVCARWRNSFALFFKDMGKRPQNMSIERKNNKGNYTPKNCVWATRIEQGANKRNNHFLTVKGVKRTVSQWSRITGINYTTLLMRIKYGWSDKKVVTTNIT